ncbi:MAG: DUF1501 domain-containing protein [Planctomycetota bacterium]|nr:DUF1501 domain-containing protein [Planctomycetota bacterium]
MDPRTEYMLLQTRRQFFSRCCQTVGGCVGLAGLHTLLPPAVAQAVAAATGSDTGGAASLGLLGAPHFAPRAKRIIYLFMSGAPSQFETFDYKPGLKDYFDVDLPESIQKGQRLTTMTSGQDRFPMVGSKYAFSQHGANGTWISELLPHTAGVVDDLCIVRSMHTDAINHDPAITFMQTGHEQPGRPSMGAWLSYGLGTENSDLPAFIVLHSTWTGRPEAQALFNRLWGTGFLPSEYQGVSLRSSGDPVLFLNNPPGVSDARRRQMLDRLAELNHMQSQAIGDPETNARIEQYEMAYRMQASVPELMALEGEPDSTFELYGPDARKPGTFAANCILARRLAERDVRFIQIYHRGWDQHANLPKDLPNNCHDIDQPCAALLTDLKQRGLLDDTLVIWGGEFGRTVYCQGPLTKENYGRDHHPRCFTMWMAGGGVRGGYVHGTTDEFSYNIVKDPVHVHDLNATVLALMGVDHEKLVYRHQGRDYRLTDVHGRVVDELMA